MFFHISGFVKITFMLKDINGRDSHWLIISLHILMERILEVSLTRKKAFHCLCMVVFWNWHLALLHRFSFSAYTNSYILFPFSYDFLSVFLYAFLVNYVFPYQWCRMDVIQLIHGKNLLHKHHCGNLVRIGQGQKIKVITHFFYAGLLLPPFLAEKNSFSRLLLQPHTLTTWQKIELGGLHVL